MRRNFCSRMPRSSLVTSWTLLKSLVRNIYIIVTTNTDLPFPIETVASPRQPSPSVSSPRPTVAAAAPKQAAGTSPSASPRPASSSVSSPRPVINAGAPKQAQPTTSPSASPRPLPTQTSQPSGATSPRTVVATPAAQKTGAAPNGAAPKTTAGPVKGPVKQPPKQGVAPSKLSLIIASNVSSNSFAAGQAGVKKAPPQTAPNSGVPKANPGPGKVAPAPAKSKFAQQAARVTNNVGIVLLIVLSVVTTVLLFAFTEHGKYWWRW
jgi:hypothetical protein